MREKMIQTTFVIGSLERFVFLKAQVYVLPLKLELCLRSFTT